MRLPSVTESHSEPSILEMAILSVREGEEAEFEQVFAQAQSIISASPGYLSHQLLRCLEEPGRYLLLVRWESLEAHTQGFRNSAAYAEWKRQLHRFYDPFPSVEHYETILAGKATP